MEASLSSLTKAFCTTNIAVALLLATVCCASAQSSNAIARGSRLKDTQSGNKADIWDANHDGVYTCDEWRNYLERLFDAADRNRDGRLDQSEFAAVRKMGTILADADFGYFDENQDGRITRSEFVDKPNEFIMQNDKNGDCRVTPDEMKDTGNDQKSPVGRGKRGQ
jgi:EF-hand domain pair